MRGLVVGSCLLVALASGASLGGEKPVPMRAIVLEVLPGPAAAQGWLAANATRLGELAGRIEFPPGYPLVVGEHELPGLGPGRFAALAGICRDQEQAPFERLREIFPGAHLRNLRLPVSRAACPVVLAMPPKIAPPVEMPMSEADPPAEDPDDPELDSELDPEDQLYLDPRALPGGLRFGRHGPVEVLRALFPQIETGRPASGVETRVVEQVQAIVGDFLALGDDSPRLTGPALAVLAVIAERYDDSVEYYPEVALVAELGGRLAVLARLGSDELESFNDSGGSGKVRVQLGKLEIAPGGFAISLLVSEASADSETEEIREEFFLMLADGEELATVAAVELVQLERGREEVEGRIERWTAGTRSKLRVSRRLEGGLFRLVVDTQETETVDGQRTMNERTREVLCFDQSEYVECDE